MRVFLSLFCCCFFLSSSSVCACFLKERRRRTSERESQETGMCARETATTHCTSNNTRFHSSLRCYLTIFLSPYSSLYPLSLSFVLAEKYGKQQLETTLCVISLLAPLSLLSHTLSLPFYSHHLLCFLLAFFSSLVLLS